MTEQELRKTLVASAVQWLGANEKDGSHRPIIDLYNSHTPRARNYRMTYTGAWCATFASAAAIGAGLTEIIPTEVSCGKQIALFQKLGSWVEDDAHVPLPGDYIYYDWDDNGKGDDDGWPEHVGIVVECDGKNIKVIEGNYKNAVGYRMLEVDGKNIRGYGVPDYASVAKKESAPIASVALRVSTKVDPLNIRKGAGTEYLIVGVAPKDTILLGRDRFNGWRHVVGFDTEGNAVEGWASEQYLTEVTY